MEKPYIHLLLLENPGKVNGNMLIQIASAKPMHTATQVLRSSSHYRECRDWVLCGFAVGYVEKPGMAPRILRGDSSLGKMVAISI